MRNRCPSGLTSLVGYGNVLKHVPLLEKLPWLRKREIPDAREIHEHQPIPRAIKDLPTIPAPQGLCPTLRGDLPSSIWPGEGTDVHFHLPGFVRGVSHQSPIRRKLR